MDKEDCSCGSGVILGAVAFQPCGNLYAVLIADRNHVPIKATFVRWHIMY